MSNHDILTIWNRLFPNQTETYDYAGRKMLKSAIGNQNSKYCPTIDHIRPLANGGHDSLDNIIICNINTNAEKADYFPTWTTNGRTYQAKRIKGKSNAYDIYLID